jgi:hypothetical protein
MCVCFIATLESLQHVSAYMGHLQVIFFTNTGIPSLVSSGNIFYKDWNTKSCLLPEETIVLSKKTRLGIPVFVKNIT